MFLFATVNIILMFTTPSWQTTTNPHKRNESAKTTLQGTRQSSSHAGLQRGAKSHRATTRRAVKDGRFLFAAV